MAPWEHIAEIGSNFHHIQIILSLLLNLVHMNQENHQNYIGKLNGLIQNLVRLFLELKE